MEIDALIYIVRKIKKKSKVNLRIKMKKNTKALMKYLNTTMRTTTLRMLVT